MTSFFDLDATVVKFTMRAACTCGHGEGYIQTRNGQDCVFCVECRKFQYNAPKTETGRAVRSTTTVHAAIKPAQRARVLLRATGRCELCSGHGRDLHVGHLLSVDDGLAEGLTEATINSDDNLCAMCSECNLGLGKLTAGPRLLIAIMLRRTQHRMDTD